MSKYKYDPQVSSQGEFWAWIRCRWMIVGKQDGDPDWNIRVDVGVLGLGGSRLAARLEGHMTLDEDEVDQLRLLLSNIDGYSSYDLSTSSRRTRRRVQVM